MRTSYHQLDFYDRIEIVRIMKRHRSTVECKFERNMLRSRYKLVRAKRMAWVRHGCLLAVEECYLPH